MAWPAAAALFSAAAVSARRWRRQRVPPTAGGTRGLHLARNAGTATLVEPETAKLALSFFVDDPEAKITPTSGGVNNIVQYVDTSTGGRYVLRVYNNGCDTPRVIFEHAILEALHQATKESCMPLSFELPRFMPSLTTSSTMMPLPSGTMCCVCNLIRGGLPKTADPRPIGRAAGELQAALGRVEKMGMVKVISSTHPYYEVYKAHAAIPSKDAFYEYLKGPSFEICRAAIDTLVAEFRLLDEAVVAMTAKGLPQQIIHGDLHYDNVLCDMETGEVTGLLDFEFSCRDWRAMELAVCLSKYVGEGEKAFPLIESFIQGFAEYGRLSRDECEGLPDMINLRVMSNCVYFVGRAIAGEDTIDSLTTRAEMYAARVVWTRQNRTRITHCISSLMIKANPDF